TLPTTTPPAVRGLLRRCLERNPKNRLHDIADARLVLDDVLAGRSDGAAGEGPSMIASGAPRARWPWPTAGIGRGLLLGAAGAWLWAALSKPAPAPLATRFTIQPPAGSTFERGIVISPDGRQIAFTARNGAGRVTLWIRALDSVEAHELPET